jgi:ribosome-binding ATPase YchF (GTP1/OBG family)
VLSIQQKLKKIIEIQLYRKKTDHSLYSPPSKETINLQLTPPTHKNFQLSNQHYQKLLEKEQEKQQEQLIAQEHLQQRLEESQAMQLIEQQIAQQQKLQQEQQIKQIQMQQMQQLQLQQQMQMQQIQMQQMQLYQLQQPMMYMPYSSYTATPTVTPVMPYGYAAQAQSICHSCKGLGFRHKKKSSKPHNQPEGVR